MLEPTHPNLVSPDYVVGAARTVGDLFLRRVAASGPRRAFQTHAGGRWVTTTWDQFFRRAAALAEYLIANGVRPGDKVCIIGATGPEWCYADIAGHLVGAVTLGAYPTLRSDQLAHILDHADVKVAFVQGQTQLAKIAACRERLTTLDRVITWDMDEPPAGPGSGHASNNDDRSDSGKDSKGDDSAAPGWDGAPTVTSLAQALAHPVPAPDALRASIDQRQEAIDPASPAIIVYTSGTTGPPKGAMISHRNILTCLDGYREVARLDRRDESFNFLPMAHVAERIAGFYGRISSGLATSFATSFATILDEVRDVRPHYFGSVPRIFEKAYARIMSAVAEAPPLRQRIFRWAERVGRRVVQHWQAGRPVPGHLRLQYRLADRLVFSKLRQVFGGRVRHFLTGAAPIAGEILEFFWAAGFPIYEAYGMTEATVITHCTRPGQVRLGSVGRPLPFIEDRIADDGEVLLRGPAVFLGYYKDPDATAAAIDKDGWLHTGDIGRKDEDGYLYIVDRKKHLIITAGGKNLSPANIENELKAADPLISQVHAHGDRRPYVTALVTIGAAETIDYARSRQMIAAAAAERLLAVLADDPLARPPELVQLVERVSADNAVRQRLVAAARRANEQLAKVETVKKIHLLHREFTIEDGELTPTLKVKRKAIEQAYADTLDRLYSDESFGLTVMARS